jgi:Uri superfamily endonuclease
VAHHRQPAARPHWHIDYLRTATRLEEVWHVYDTTRREHQWAGVFRRARGASLPLRGFGASDCSCVSHLFFFATRPASHAFRRRLRRAFPDHGPVYADQAGASMQDSVPAQDTGTLDGRSSPP